jgi:hypothetical protein
LWVFVLVVFGHNFHHFAPNPDSFLPETYYEQARNQHYFGPSDPLHPLFLVRAVHLLRCFAPNLLPVAIIANWKLNTTQFIPVKLGSW